MSFENIIKYLLIGLLAGYCIFYSFASHTVYPRSIIYIFDHPWIILMLLLLSILLFEWSNKLGAIAILIVTAFVVDAIIFCRPIQKPKYEPIILTQEVSKEELEEKISRPKQPNDVYTMLNDIAEVQKLGDQSIDFGNISQY